MTKTTNLENIQQNRRPRTLNPLLAHPPQQALEPRIIPLDDRPRAEESHDPRTFGKRAEHDGDPAVLVNMTDGLAAGAGGVDVGGVVGAEDGEGG